MARRISYIDPVSAKLSQQQKGKAAAFGVSLKPVLRKLDITDPSPAPNGCADGEDENNDHGARAKPQRSEQQSRGSKMDPWRNKVAIITGASSGIGAATARRLVEEGMIVVGAARRYDKLEELKSELPSGKFHPVKCDVAVESDVVQLFVMVKKKFGRADVLINNAGVAHCTSLIDPSVEALEALFAVNVIGPCLCNREFLRLHRERNLDTGYIMFTNSTLGHTVTNASPGNGYLYHYPHTASKHALRAVMEGLRQELRATGSKIRVGEVSPSEVETQISSSFATFGSPSSKKQNQAQSAKSIEPLQPEDIADAFVFMLSAPERADVNEIILYHKSN